MLDKFDFGLFNSRLTYAAWFSIRRSAVFFVSKDYYFACFVDILTFNDGMNFCMKKYFVRLIYLLSILGLHWVGLNIGITSHAENIAFAVIDYCGYCVFFAHTGRP